MKIHSRVLLKQDYARIRELLITEAPNEWNYITEDTINNQFRLLQQNRASIVLLEDNDIDDRIVGFSIILLREDCPAKFKKYEALSNIAYIEDVVVSKNYSGKGFGSRLLLASMDVAHEENIETVYIERHEQNLASAGMMRKAGFEVVETFYNPEKRTSRSRNTTVLKKGTA